MNKESVWFENIYHDLTINQKKIVLIAGASCSGKSTSADNLVTFLRSKGNSAIHISADMYYKGLAKNVTMKALMNEKFKEFQSLEPEITKRVREIIEFCAFENKFSEANMSKIEKVLSPILKTNTKEFVSLLKYSCEHINFDEPFAIDFDFLASDINNLVNGETIIIPDYSFTTSEMRLSNKNKCNGKNYDYIIIEGLYVLRDDLTNKIDTSLATTAFLNCDYKTLLERRFNRDIIRHQHSGFTPQRTIMMTLDNVMPAYQTYIHPTLSKAQFVLDAHITNKEVNEKPSTSVHKFKLNNEQATKFLKDVNAEEVDKDCYIDHYFNDNNEDNNISMALRQNNKEDVVALTFKFGNDTTYRHIQYYDLLSYLIQVNRNFNFLKSLFIKSGFSLDLSLRKTRISFLANINNVKIPFSIVSIPDLGSFLELSQLTNTQLQQILPFSQDLEEFNIPYSEIYKQINHSKQLPPFLNDDSSLIDKIISEHTSTNKKQTTQITSEIDKEINTNTVD